PLASVTSVVLGTTSPPVVVSDSVTVPLELTLVVLCTGRGGNCTAVAFGAQSQEPAADTEQSNCSAATAYWMARGCMASRLPVTSNGNFLRNAGDFNAILLIRASCAPSARGGAARLSMG